MGTLQGSQSCLHSLLPALNSQYGSCALTTSAIARDGKGPDAKNSPEQKKGVRTDPDLAPPDDDRQNTPSSKKTNELVYSMTSSPVYPPIAPPDFPIAPSLAIAWPHCLASMHKTIPGLS